MIPPELEKQLSLKSNDAAPPLSANFTGRYFLILNEGSGNILKTIHLLNKKWGIEVACTADFISELPNESELKGADALIYNDLGIALVGVEEQRIRSIGSSDPAFVIVPERVIYIPGEMTTFMPDEVTTEDDLRKGYDEAAWGIRATRAFYSQYTGEGIGIAVLDTGFDAKHPDFMGRSITTSSFVLGETVKDKHGHGTHCIGTACGSEDMHGTRYGIATHAHIHAAKVLNNNGYGAQSWVLSGMSWAVKKGCKVISMSLGSTVGEGESYDMAYERAGRYALSKGALIMAAAGNESIRSENRFSPVGSPADCPSILAIAAIDRSLRVADFSNRALNPSAKVDFAAPGVDIYSSWIMPDRYLTLSGSSMATPHAAGIAALLFGEFRDATPAFIEEEMRKRAKALPYAPEDVGAGLISV